eukprot:m51a1_g8807 hypothetical protein (140) ;mRNA; r:281434-282012
MHKLAVLAVVSLSVCTAAAFGTFRMGSTMVGVAAPKHVYSLVVKNTHTENVAVTVEYTSPENKVESEKHIVGPGASSVFSARTAAYDTYTAHYRVTGVLVETADGKLSAVQREPFNVHGPTKNHLVTVSSNPEGLKLTN